MQQTHAVIDVPIGKLAITCHEHALTHIRFVQQNTSLLCPNHSTTLLSTLNELTHYFNGAKKTFSCTLDLIGTPFQKRVWQALSEIPYGQTRTYADLATLLKTSPRAVGNACRDNPIPIIIPCHRIVSSTSLGGYSGQTKGPLLKIKEWLLTHERKHS